VSRILIVDDDPDLRKALGDRVRHWGHAVDDAGDLATARAALARRAYDLVLLDLQLPDGSGIELLDAARKGDPPVPVVMLTAHGSIESAVEAVRAGAVDFLSKPADFELLKLVVERVLEHARLTRANRAWVERDAERDARLIADAPAMRELLALAAQAARSRATILITGENGSGKQELAEFVHRRSDRAQAPFVYVNCVAVPEELIEATLFGHERGAFTGALTAREGRLEAADSGTVFLDEIGDISPRMQTRLLHFLETGEFERVGGTRTLHLDCRIVAATNRDLPRAIREGRFREDLYFRLNVIGLRMPPLRERLEDLPALATSMAERCAREMGRPAPSLAPATLQRLRRHAWPGNVRELRNAIERMVVLAPGSELTPDLLPPEIAGGATPGAGEDAPLDLRAAVERFKREHVARVLALTGGHRTRAAELLGLQRTHLSVLLKKLGLSGRDDNDGNDPA
jgi:DNA-binding NtrC family response regulator